MTANDIDKRLEQVKGYARTLVTYIRVMEQRREILAPLLYNSELKETLDSKLNQTKAAELLPLIQKEFTEIPDGFSGPVWAGPGEKDIPPEVLTNEMSESRGSLRSL